MELKDCCKIWKAFKDKGTGVIILEDSNGKQLEYSPSRINGCPTCFTPFESLKKTELPEEIPNNLLIGFTDTPVMTNTIVINEIIRYLKAKGV